MNSIKIHLLADNSIFVGEKQKIWTLSTRFILAMVSQI